MGRKVPPDEDWSFLVRFLQQNRAPQRLFQCVRRLRDKAVKYEAGGDAK